MSGWSDVVDPLLAQRLLRREVRPGMAQLAQAQRIHARHHALAERSALAERLASRGRLVGATAIPIVDAVRTRAAADAPQAPPRSTRTSTSSRGAPAPSRPIAAVANRTSVAMIQRKSLRGAPERPSTTRPASWVPDPTDRVKLGTGTIESGALESPGTMDWLSRPRSVPDDGSTGIPVRSNPVRVVGRRVEPGASRRTELVVAADPKGATTDMSVTRGVESGPRDTSASAPAARQSMFASGPPAAPAGPAVASWALRSPVVVRSGVPNDAVTRAAEVAPAASAVDPVLPVVAELMPAGPRPGAEIPRESVPTIPMTWSTPVAAESRRPPGQAAPVPPAVSAPAEQVHPSDQRVGPHAEHAVASAPVDVDRLADVVHAKLLRRLAIERERRGVLR